MNDKYMPYKDSSLTPEVRADDLLSRMSIEEKMGQIQGYNPANWSNDNLENDYPHGVGEVSFLVASELKSAKQTAENMSKIQKKVMELSEHSIPAIFHIETLCGVLMPGATSFPSGIAQGSTWNPSILKKMASIIRREARAVGMRHAFAPVLDISRVRWGAFVRVTTVPYPLSYPVARRTDGRKSEIIPQGHVIEASPQATHRVIEGRARDAEISRDGGNRLGFQPLGEIPQVLGKGSDRRGYVAGQ